MGITSSRAISLPAIIAGLGGGNAVGTNATATGATLTNSLSTGNATNPNFVIQVGVKTTSGAAQATATTAVTITGETLLASFAGAVSVNGATPGSNALAVTGTSGLAGNVTVTGTITASNVIRGLNATQVDLTGDGLAYFSNNAGTNRFVLGVAGAIATPNIRLGDVAVDTAPVAQTLSVQNTLAGGTSNVAGANFTIAGSQGKGTGGGGNIIIQTAPAGSTGTTVNALATAATVYGNGDVGIGIGSAIATSATAGFLLIPTCAGTPTGVVANAAAGKAALVYDTTGGILWLSISGSSWKQPKTVGTVLTVAWS